jgi:hypothetical protein
LSIPRNRKKRIRDMHISEEAFDRHDEISIGPYPNASKPLL